MNEIYMKKNVGVPYTAFGRTKFIAHSIYLPFHATETLLYSYIHSVLIIVAVIIIIIIDSNRSWRKMAIEWGEKRRKRQGF